MPSLTFDISAHDVPQYFIQIFVWTNIENENSALYICEAKIPIWKMFDK